MSVDVTSLLLGSAFALFLALLAWGDQIRKPRKEVTELEERFREEYGVEKKTLNPLLRKSYDDINSTQKYSFIQQTKAMIDVMQNKKLKGGNVKLLKKLEKLHAIRENLEKKYDFRYIFSIWFCVVLFVLGTISIFTNDLTIMTFPVNLLYLVIAIIFISVYIINFVRTHYKEEEFFTETYQTDDAIEAQ